jgi:uncharacterized membrane protein
MRAVDGAGGLVGRVPEHVRSDVGHRALSHLLLLQFVMSIPASISRAVRTRLLAYGRAPMCNLRPERAFRVGVFVLPLCTRCTGILLGTLASQVVAAIATTSPLALKLRVLLLLPMALDWLGQRAGVASSTNSRRVLTGFLCGIGVSGL